MQQSLKAMPLRPTNVLSSGMWLSPSNHGVGRKEVTPDPVDLSGWLQITVVVLLDSFMKASAAMELEDENHKIARNKDESSGPLDPLLKKICEEFVDDQDLTDKLQKLFKAILFLFLAFLDWHVLRCM